MTNQRTNDDWLAAARADLACRGPDPVIEAQLLARVRERRALRSVEAACPPQRAARSRPRPQARPRWRWLRLFIGVPVAVAAAAAALIATLRLTPPAPEEPVREVATPFIALVGTDALAAERSPVIVPSRVARTALVDYGLPLDPARADETVGAEFLVSRTGVVLAVRFRE